MQAFYDLNYIFYNIFKSIRPSISGIIGTNTLDKVNIKGEAAIVASKRQSNTIIT